jgi:hypothetical protein
MMEDKAVNKGVCEAGIAAKFKFYCYYSAKSA